MPPQLQHHHQGQGHAAVGAARVRGSEGSKPPAPGQPVSSCHFREGRASPGQGQPRAGTQLHEGGGRGRRGRLAGSFQLLGQAFLWPCLLSRFGGGFSHNFFI